MQHNRAPHFREVAATLDRADAALGAAGSHGLLCGLLSASPAAPVEEWTAEVMPDAEPGDLLVAEARDLLEHLFHQTRDALASPDLGFAPLLPPDRAPIMERGRALAEWCDGFLYGLGLGGYGPEGRSSEVREFVADLEELTKLGVAHEGEEDELAMAELIEYVRVGVLLVSTMPVETGGGPEDTLH